MWAAWRGDRRRPAHGHQPRRREEITAESHVRDRRPLRRSRDRHEMHQDPHVLNYGAPPRSQARAGPRPGIEPMVTVGDPATRSSRTGDCRHQGRVARRALRAHRGDHPGPWVLTAEDGGIAAWPRSGSPPAPTRTRPPSDGEGPWIAVPPGGLVAAGTPGYSERRRSRRPVVVLWPHDPGRPRESVCTTCSATTDCVYRGSPVAQEDTSTTSQGARVGMAKKDGAIEVEGRVVEPLPNAMFRVELPDGHRVSPTSAARCASTTSASCPRTAGRGASALRPDPRSHRLPLQVTLGPRHALEVLRQVAPAHDLRNEGRHR